MLIPLVPYNAQWPNDFNAIAIALNNAFGDLATHIDHIGSTSVIGLTAKPVIDVQVTVKSLSAIPAIVISRLKACGFIHRTTIKEDRPPPWEEQAPLEWSKTYFKSVDGAYGRVQVHVRETGRRNQRYALLFRDYLRSNERARDAYGDYKIQLANAVGHLSQPGGTGLYLDLKDPVFDLIADSAERWASEINWSTDKSLASKSK